MRALSAQATAARQNAAPAQNIITVFTEPYWKQLFQFCRANVQPEAHAQPGSKAHTLGVTIELQADALGKERDQHQ
jgi:hypothetical protein